MMTDAPDGVDYKHSILLKTPYFKKRDSTRAPPTILLVLRPRPRFSGVFEDEGRGRFAAYGQCSIAEVLQQNQHSTFGPKDAFSGDG